MDEYDKRLEQAKVLVTKVRHASYATVNEDGSPHNSPLMWIFNDDLSKIYIGSHSDSQHVANILRTGQAFVGLFDSFVKGQGGLYITAVNGSECVGDGLDEALHFHNIARARHGGGPIDISYYQDDKPSQCMYSLDVAKIEIYTQKVRTDGLIASETRVEVKAKELV